MGFRWAAFQTLPDWPSFRFFLRVGCLRSCLLAFHFSARGKSWIDPPARDTAFFEGDSVDYGAKPRCCTEWKHFEIMQGGEKRSWSINRKLHFLGHSLLIRSGSACLFLRQSRGWVCNLPSCTQWNATLPFHCRFQPDIFSLGKVQVLARYVHFGNANTTREKWWRLKGLSH